MARFSSKVATELVVVSVQLMMTIRPISSNRDIDKYRESCIEILRLKYNDTKALRSFCDNLSPLVMNTYNAEMAANELMADMNSDKEFVAKLESIRSGSTSKLDEATISLDESTISAVDRTIKFAINEELTFEHQLDRSLLMRTHLLLINKLK